MIKERLVAFRKSMIAGLARDAQAALLDSAPETDPKKAVAGFDAALRTWRYLLSQSHSSTHESYALKDLGREEAMDYEAARHAIAMLVKLYTVEPPLEFSTQPGELAAAMADE